ncbi:alpha/beta hydrolase [Pseudonocardia kujensis]|uniref:alpha/beta fold hydrolase n=1 Tax=Pseudonocardia kujensis TaxID=1128675 RepID=UPI001E61F09F|nr:alpha/beta hydrolase [Pseudonocardia kujensis]MCE0765668.1 alpha/beta hydrolase [Pseudonocardia kujensis]
MADMTGFTSFDVAVDGVRIHGTRGGEGPPVLLLHGFPQSHVMWRPVMRELAARHTVVATDLRGYGESDRPPSGEDHAGYSFRAMAADQAGVMAELGFERFAVVGHDRGARVTHRLALDHADRVERLALLDILPTSYVYEHVDRSLAQAYYHWFFFIQPADLPERLIAGDPIYYLHRLLGSWGSGLAAHDAESLAAYEKAFADPEARHAMLEDYRAGATVDLEHDAEGARLRAPTLVLWGEKGVVGRNPEPPTTVWRRLAAEPALVTGRAIPGAGHFLVEENLPATLSALTAFLSA